MVATERILDLQRAFMEAAETQWAEVDFPLILTWPPPALHDRGANAATPAERRRGFSRCLNHRLLAAYWPLHRLAAGRGSPSSDFGRENAPRRQWEATPERPRPPRRHRDPGGSDVPAGDGSAGAVGAEGAHRVRPRCVRP